MSGEAPAIIHNAREAWLLARRDKITASDVAAILGEHPTKRPSDVFLEKIGLAEAWDSIPASWGQDLQDGVGRGYARATGRPVRMERIDLPELVVHPSIPWIACTRDGLTEGCEKTPPPAGCNGVGVLETKATSDLGGRWERDDAGVLNPPVEFVVQVQVQAACSGLEWGSLTAFVSMFKLPPWKDIPFDQELFDLMVPELEKFRQCVITKTPPSDPEWFSMDAVKKLYGVESGATVDLGDGDLAIVQEWEMLKASRLLSEKREEELAKTIRLRMGAATVGKLPDGSALALTTVAAGRVEAYDRAAYRRLTRRKGKGKK